MAGRKRTYHHGDLAPALVAEARRVVASSGADAVSLRQVASAVGVSPNATYRHFPDKAALLVEVARQAFEELAKRMRRAAPASTDASPVDAIDRLKTIGRTYVGFARKNPELFRLMFGPHGYRCLSSEDGPGDTMPFTVLSDALDALHESKTLSQRAREGAEVPAWTMIHGFTALALEGALGEAGDAAETVEMLLDFVVGGLVARSR